MGLMAAALAASAIAVTASLTVSRHRSHVRTLPPASSSLPPTRQRAGLITCTAPSSVQQTLSPLSPRLVDTATAQRSEVVRLRGFLSEGEIAELHDAAAEVKGRIGEVARSHGCDPETWKTVYMNALLPEVLPAFHRRLLDAFREVDAAHWDLLDDERRMLNLRCAEYHTVLPGGGLPIEKHMDHGSLLTLDIMLSDTSHFTGGVFQTLEADGQLKQHTFERGDALVFNSHKFHCVSPVTSGRRNVFVCELWEGLPRRCPRRCTDPWMPCYCAYAPVALYQRHEEQYYTPM